MTQTTQLVNGTLRPSSDLEGYLVFTPDTPEEMDRTTKHGDAGYVEEVQVNVGHPALVRRAKEKYGGVNVEAAMRGETVPAAVWEAA